MDVQRPLGETARGFCAGGEMGAADESGTGAFRDGRRVLRPSELRPEYMAYVSTFSGLERKEGRSATDLHVST